MNMGLYIHGMKLPPKGKVKMLVLFDDGVLLDNADGQNQWMAIELSPHGRLIDADAVIEDIRCEILEHQLNGMKGTPFYIEDLRTMWQRLEDEDIAPTIIPAEGGADNG
jgi:hypothetical protein